MLDKLQNLYPEMTLLAAACTVMILGLSRTAALRRLCWVVAGAALASAGVLAYFTTGPASHALPNLPLYGKVLTAGIGMLLLLLVAGTADRQYEARVAGGAVAFDPLHSTRGEFYAFFLFSLAGVMLCCGADDLIWLFLALELVSLPTYIMVATSTARNRSMEAAVKYFFLGAMGAAIFLYGFALIYGATGATGFAQIKFAFGAQMEAGGGAAGLNPIGVIGIIMALIGIGFKIAAAPMHFYAADVYQGASASIAGFLAFVPKTAGFVAIMLLLSTLAWTLDSGTGLVTLPPAINATLWIMAVATMTIGNVMALLQSSVKRILAYSSIAHSGYMLVGIIAGPGEPGTLAGSGLAATLYYLLVYGVMNLGAFAVVACLQKPAAGMGRGTNQGAGADAGALIEIDALDDIRGLCATHPFLGWIMVLCSASMLGLPPLLGFFGKLPLFSAGITAGQITLVVIMGLNSAIGAVYYLRLAAYPLLEQPDPAGMSSRVTQTPVSGRWLAGVLSAAGVVVLAVVPLTGFAKFGARYTPHVFGGGNPSTRAAAAETPVAQK
ncbi:hypothetical protein BH11PLA1_BH11PLA1_13100 [soil metagenome]